MYHSMILYVCRFSFFFFSFLQLRCRRCMGRRHRQPSSLTYITRIRRCTQLNVCACICVILFIIMHVMWSAIVWTLSCRHGFSANISHFFAHLRFSHSTKNKNTFPKCCTDLSLAPKETKNKTNKQKPKRAESARRVEHKNRIQQSALHRNLIDSNWRTKITSFFSSPQLLLLSYTQTHSHTHTHSRALCHTSSCMHTAFSTICPFDIW